MHKAMALANNWFDEWQRVSLEALLQLTKLRPQGATAIGSQRSSSHRTAPLWPDRNGRVRSVRARGWIYRRIARLMLCVAFFGATAPAISHFLASATGITWAEICSVTGPKLVALELGSPQTPKLPHSTEHCPFCLLQNHSPAIPTSASLPVFAASAVDATLAGVANSPPLARFIRRSHLTRAPPAFS